MQKSMINMKNNDPVNREKCDLEKECISSTDIQDLSKWSVLKFKKKKNFSQIYPC